MVERSDTTGIPNPHEKHPDRDAGLPRRLTLWPIGEPERGWHPSRMRDGWAHGPVVSLRSTTG